LPSATEQEINEGPHRIVSDSEWERAVALHSANQAPNEGTGAEAPSHKLANYRKDGTRRSYSGNSEDGQSKLVMI
jgi:hypothetical protein